QLGKAQGACECEQAAERPGPERVGRTWSNPKNAGRNLKNADANNDPDDDARRIPQPQPGGDAVRVAARRFHGVFLTEFRSASRSWFQERSAPLPHGTLWPVSR